LGCGREATAAQEVRISAAHYDEHVTETEQRSKLDILLRRDLTPHRISLEDLVAYQWEAEGDVVGALHGQRRNRLTLSWLAAAVERVGRPAAVLDIGCAYGTHLFMLNAFLGKPRDVALVGIDLFEGAIDYANAFAEAVPGFGNCSFRVADLAAGLPFEDDSFHAINLADVLEHLPAPEEALREIWRVAKPGGSVIVSTPLRDSLFKRLARLANRVSGGRIYGAYYTGKDAELDESGQPIMETCAGLDHVSEMNWNELQRIVSRTGFRPRQIEFMSVMSGSRWFDRHKALLAGVLLVEAAHDVLRRPNWGHSVMLDLVVTKNDGRRPASRPIS
jgi:SAM-dependent methyltransferase